MKKQLLSIIIASTALSMQSQPPAQPINNEKQIAITALTAWAFYILYNVYQNSNNKNDNNNLIVGINASKR